MSGGVSLHGRASKAWRAGTNGGLHATLWEVAWREPRRPAAIDAQGEVLSHGALASRAARLARALVERGVRPGALVAMALRDPLDEVVAALGVLHAGAALVPLDPAWPADRLRAVVDDCRPSLVLGAAVDGVPALALTDVRDLRDVRPLAPPALDVGGEAPAYVIYTSGSTGRPKGVVVSHQNALHLLRARLDLHAEAPPERLLALVPSTFDPWLSALAWALGAGGALVLVPDETRRDPAAAAALVVRARATHVLAATPLYAALLDAATPEQLATLRGAVVGGEALTRGVVERHRARAPGVPLWNEYGPTEATVVTTVHRVPLDGPVPERPPIGRPIGQARCHVVDEAGREVPPGEAGELWIGGPGVAIGYLGQPERTRARFLPDPFTPSPDARVYRTGDRVRRLPSGELEFLGRLDDQVKLRGHRIELGEVEAALAAQPGVRDAAAVVRPDAPGGPALVAYVVLKPGYDRTPLALRRGVAALLPAAAVPTLYVTLAALPRTAAGKLDRASLPPPGPEHLARDQAPAPLQGETQARLAEIWSGLLGVPVLGPGDDFFMLGGHSLLAGRCVARIEEVFGVEVPLRELFEAPTLEGLAERVDAARRAAAAPGPAAPAPAADAAPPRTPPAAPSAAASPPPPPPSPTPTPTPSPTRARAIDRARALARSVVGAVDRRASFHLGARARLGLGRCASSAAYLTPSQARAAQQVLAWAADYIGKPHPELGRNGPICPFVPTALRQDALHVAVCDAIGPASTPEELDRALLEHVHAFRRRFPIAPDDHDAPLWSVVVAFPNLVGEAGAAVDGCHTRLKYFLMPRGVMVSQFHPACGKPGVHNREFALYKAPLPCVVIRHMGVHDIVFVDRHRASFLEYRRRFGARYEAGEIGDEHGYATRYAEALRRFALE